MGGNARKMWHNKKIIVDMDHACFEKKTHRYYCPKCMAGFREDAHYKAHYKLEHGKK